VVEPAQPETRVGAALPGRIARVAVAEGAQLAAGDVLVEFEQEVERAALAAAEAEVTAAAAQLARAPCAAAAARTSRRRWPTPTAPPPGPRCRGASPTG
jgi:multidrug efflux pump subunit AcrA (membrane-fusion protein)